MSRHINIPIFVPHLGCPNQCTFCNQCSISGKSRFSLDEMEKTIEDSLSTASKDDEVEIAFFGGSFTGIEENLMTEILELAYRYKKSGRVASMRCSTRPDYVTPHILDVLERYGVKTVELGIQSMSDEVLLACRRGHTAEDSRRAASLLVSRGFSFVGQMMVGLPMSNPENERTTAREIVALGAVGARVYPTVVFRKTELCEQAEQGIYVPLSLSEAVSRSADLVEIFRDHGVKLLRVGLQATETLSDPEEIFGGPLHSAIGELVESEIYKRKIVSLLKNETFSPELRIFVAKGCVSAAVGQHQSNKTYLCEAFGFSRVTVVENEALRKGEIMIKTEERKWVCT